VFVKSVLTYSHGNQDSVPADPTLGETWTLTTKTRTRIRDRTTRHLLSTSSTTLLLINTISNSSTTLQATNHLNKTTTLDTKLPLLSSTEVDTIRTRARATVSRITVVPLLLMEDMAVHSTVSHSISKDLLQDSGIREEEVIQVRATISIISLLLTREVGDGDLLVDTDRCGKEHA
jgi:hypothetical protein